MRRLVYLVGEPGAGKSTLLAGALKGWERVPFARPVAHQLLLRRGGIGGVELGVHRPMYPGTDALPMNAITGAIELLDHPPAELVIGEGARLGCRRFLSAAVERGYEVLLVWVSNPWAAQQRAERGSNQNPSWIKGQITRVNNLTGNPPPGVEVCRIPARGLHSVEHLQDLLDMEACE